MMQRNEYSKKFGSFLYNYLPKIKRTQAEVACSLDITHADLSRKILNGRKFSIDEFIKICDYLNMDYNETIKEIKNTYG